MEPAADPMTPADTMPMPTENPMVGGAPMMADKDIIDNAMNSKDHTTLVAAVKAAGLVDTLLKPEMKGDLTTVLTYHVVPGKLDAAALMAKIK
ncbi:MAG: fasciclin domain-containing protein, partial [Rhodoferax sp.]|nr:fasciclin domain-containing protein [Rhodoferax sp.]